MRIFGFHVFKVSLLIIPSIRVKPLFEGAGWDGRTWLRLWPETSHCDEFHDGRLNDSNLCHNQSRKNALVWSWWRINGADSQHIKLIHSNIKKIVKIHFMEEVMGKIIKEIVCENGDCSNKSIKFYLWSVLLQSMRSLGCLLQWFDFTPFEETSSVSGFLRLIDRLSHK